MGMGKGQCVWNFRDTRCRRVGNRSRTDAIWQSFPMKHRTGEADPFPHPKRGVKGGKTPLFFELVCPQQRIFPQESRPLVLGKDLYTCSPGSIR